MERGKWERYKRKNERMGREAQGKQEEGIKMKRETEGEDNEGGTGRNDGST
jgi:hypothetical protein